MSSTLQTSAQALAAEHDVALLDLDGVVYVGAHAVPGAPDALHAAREAGMRLAFVTNNAARPPYVVADHLNDLGIPADSSEVITSAQAAARYLADHLPGGARVLVVGTTGLTVALQERGLTPVFDASGRVDAVVQGYSPELNWHQLAEGAVAINSGVLWVATNTDPTVPSARGPLPGNGSLVAALRLATRREPIVTGKPDPTMHRETLLRTDAQRPLVVGDRLDTDIEGANAAGCPSLLVLSGVTRLPDLLTAPPRHRPSYVGADVSSLLDIHVGPVESADGWTCGQWLVTAEIDRSGDRLLHVSTPVHDPGSVERAGSEEITHDDLDPARALCSAAWALADQAERSSDPAYVAPRVDCDGQATARLLARLGFDV